MSKEGDNDDCSAKCPKCGKTTVLALLRKDFDKPIQTVSIHCRECGWAENWEKDPEFGGFLKQPKKPEIVKKTFVVEYIKDTIFGEKYIRDSLNYRIKGDPFTDVYEIESPITIPKLQDGGIIIDPNILRIIGNHECGKIPEGYEIIKSCNNCGWKYYDEHDYECCESPNVCFKFDQWKPIKKEEKVFQSEGKVKKK